MADVEQHLRPAGVGETLDTSFRLFRRHFKFLFTLVGVGIIPFQLLLGLFILSRSLSEVGSPTLTGTTFSFELVLLLNGVYALLVLPWMISATAIASGRLVTQGEEIGWRTAYRGGRPFILRVLAITIVVPVISGLGLILLVIPGILCIAWFGLSPCAAVMEDKRMVSAMGRSRALVRGNFWRVIGFGIVAAVIIYLMTFAAGLVGLAAAEAVLALGAPSLGFLSTFLAEGLINTVAYSYGLLALTVLYYQLRARKEGLDLHMEAERLLGGTDSGPAAPASDAPASPTV